MPDAISAYSANRSAFVANELRLYFRAQTEDEEGGRAAALFDLA